MDSGNRDHEGKVRHVRHVRHASFNWRRIGYAIGSFSMGAPLVNEQGPPRPWQTYSLTLFVSPPCKRLVTLENACLDHFSASAFRTARAST
jgi:hypothetical protein